MKIKSVRLISYGKFKNKEIAFSDKLNIVTGDNESGKSTVMSFIRGMLYGFSGKGGDISKNERKKYIPWDGEVLAGEMDIETKDGRRLTLIRKTGKTQAKDEYSVINTDTGEAAEFNAADELGIGEEGFRNTVFIRQSGALISGGNDEISDKLISLMQSGDESGGYYKAAEALTDEMRKLKHFKGNGGIIYDLNCKIAALSEELSEIERFTNSQLSAVREQKKLSALTDTLTQSLKRIENDREKAETQKLFIAEREAKNKRAQTILEYENAAKAKDKTESALSQYAQFERDADEIIFTSAPSDEEYKSDAVQAKKSAKRLCTFAVVAFGAALLSGIASVFVMPIITAAIIFAAAGVFLLVSSARQKKAAETANAKIAEIMQLNQKRIAELEKYGCTGAKEYTEKKAEYTALKERHAAICDKMNALQSEIEKAEQAVSDTRRIITEKYGELKNFDMAPAEYDPAEEERLRRELDRAVREHERISGQLCAQQQGRRTFDVAEAERMRAMEELFEAEQKYAALELAKKTLDSAYENLSKYFSPALSDKASRILSKMTGNEEKILSDKKFYVTLGRDGLHEINYFSCGTAEQVYLALRIAIADIILGEQTPLFLDDSFTAYDNARCSRALSMLCEMSETRQIIVFSCRELPQNTAETIKL